MKHMIRLTVLGFIKLFFLNSFPLQAESAFPRDSTINSPHKDSLYFDNYFPDNIYTSSNQQALLNDTCNYFIVLENKKRLNALTAIKVATSCYAFFSHQI